MRKLSALLLPAAAALAILSVAPVSSFAANNPPRDEEVVHQSSEATNSCQPQYEIWESHVKWLKGCSTDGQTGYQVYGSHVARQ